MRWSCSASRRPATRPPPRWWSGWTTAAAASCRISCCRRSASTPLSAAWCRRSPPAPMSRRSTTSSPRRWPRPSRASTRIDGVAAAAGPGLIGGVIVGLTTAKAIALVKEKPLIAVNHLEAHALTARLTDGTPFPYCLFLASGGHTQILAVRGVGDYVRLGTTVDDAIGEAFDKTAKLLGLALSGRPAGRAGGAARRSARFALPRPMAGQAERRFLALGAEDRAAAGSREDRADQRPGRARPLRVVPAGGGRRGRRSPARRPALFREQLRQPDRAGRRRRRRRQRGDPQGAAPPRLRGRHRAGGAAAPNCAPTTAR